MARPSRKTTTPAPKKRSERRHLQHVAGARLSDDEMARLRAVAAAEETSVSTYLRNLVLREIGVGALVG